VIAMRNSSRIGTIVSFTLLSLCKIW
jgi:hypothetical protein